MYERQGRTEEALSLHRELLEYLVDRAVAPEADANTLNGAAWELLTGAQELRDPAAALPLAIRANQMTDHRNPGYLDTLALAQQMNGLGRLPYNCCQGPGAGLSPCRWASKRR